MVALIVLACCLLGAIASVPVIKVARGFV